VGARSGGGESDSGGNRRQSAARPAELPQELGALPQKPLFRGIRQGRSLSAELDNTAFVADLKALAQAGLELDAIGGPPVLRDVVRVSDLVPELRIVINHLPFDTPAEPAARKIYRDALRELGKRPQVYAKVSNVPRRSGDKVPEDMGFYRPALDELWETFGADRVIYGSNWPVSARVAPYHVAFKIVSEYFTAKVSKPPKIFLEELAGGVPLGGAIA